MIRWRWSSCAVVLIFWMLSGSGLALAESLGTFRWRLAPFCNVLTLTVGTDGAVSGYDDGCGASQRQAAVGSAFPNPDGTVGIGVTVLSPTGPPGSIQALLGAGASSGTWHDQVGNAGAFVFNPAASPQGAPRPLTGCPPDSVRVGPTCIDKYEASVWYVPSVLTQLIQKIRSGAVTKADFEADWVPAPVQVGLAEGDLAAFGCTATGTDAGCMNIYVVSLAGVQPARAVTWFQAVAAARNSGKRLPTNAEWQAAALGTPEESCNTDSVAAIATGTSPGCVSHVGAWDMVGNLFEWVDAWVPRSEVFCPATWGAFSNDSQRLCGAEVTGGPGALLRGGFFFNGNFAGVHSVLGYYSPADTDISVGFRGAR